MPRFLRVSLLFLVLFLVVPAAVQAATVTASGNTLTFTAGAGETNTAVIAKQQTPDTYFVGDQNPAVTVTRTSDVQTMLACTATPAGSGLPPGFLCVVPGATSLVENLADGNDTGVISAGSSPPEGTINGGDGTDTLVGGTEKDIFNGGAGTDTVAYVSINAAGINRTAGVTATLPDVGAVPTTTNGQPGENDSIASDVENLVGTNNGDTLTGNSGPNTIAGTVPPGTPGVDTPTFAGVDTINGLGDNDTLVTVGGGTANGGEGNDTVVGGSTTTSAAATLNGDAGDDNLVSGLGKDDLNGGDGTDFLVYASVAQVGIKRMTGVTAALADATPTTGNGKTGSMENDTIHSDIENLVGSNGDDTLTGNSAPNTIVGAAPAGTPGVDPGPTGTDTINGAGAGDTLLASDNGTVNGGTGDDTLLGGSGATALNGDAGSDRLVSGTGNDTLSGGDGSDFAVYASVAQAGIHRTSGVRATLANTGMTTAGNGSQASSSTESDTIRADVENLVGSNRDDILTGNDGANTIVGVVPAGTPGADAGPPGNDTLNGAGGNDVLFGDTGSDSLSGGTGADVLLAGDGNDTLTGDAGVDTFSAGAGVDFIRARDLTAESSISCGAGADTVQADPTDKPAADCETVDAGPKPPVVKPDTTPPVLSVRPGTLVLRSGRKVALYLRCANEPKGCHGVLEMRTANRVRAAGTTTRRFYTLARVNFSIPNGNRKRFVVQLARVTPKLVAHRHSLALRATVRARDTSGNLAQKAFALKLYRP